MKNKQDIGHPWLMLLAVLCIVACGGAKGEGGRYTIEQNPPFEIGDVYYQDWVAGIKEGGSGTNLHVTFKSYSKDVVIQQLYFRNKTTKAQQSPSVRNQFVGYFKNEDATGLIMDSDPTKEAQNTPPIKFPFVLEDDEAVVSYLENDTVRYARITNIRREEMLAYPSSKPNDEN